MPPWDLSETREHISRLFGRKQLELAAPPIRSVDDRQTYARIHFQAARASIEAYVSAELQESSLMEATLGNQEGWAKFNIFIREVGAHLTACIQSIHAVPDILANALYYSLALNVLPDPLKPRSLSATSVITRLKQEPATTKLAVLLNTLLTGGDFQHLAALANQAKHRSIVFPSLNEDYAGPTEGKHAVVFPKFEHEGNTYRQVLAEEFLKTEYARCSALVVEIGGTLNTVLASREP